MSNIIHISNFAQVHSFRQEAFILCEWIERLNAHAEEAKPKIEKSKSVAKTLETYGGFLRRYYEMAGCFEISMRQLKLYVANDEQRKIVATVQEDLQLIHSVVTGKHPWLSLPNSGNTAFMAWSQLDTITDSLKQSYELLMKNAERKRA